ncbi:snare protein syntaxin 18/UFE1 [Infundibulicybe gibba]|nr:snare protein syntaxin 18/UFE1 [Infundibulicybe gibba]
MPFQNRTDDFRQFVHEKENNDPEAKRKRVVHTPEHLVLSREYTTEAYIILKHINALTHMLTSIRKPYLNIDSRNSPLSRQTSRHIDLTESDTSWSNIRHLTNEERTTLTYRHMEALEKRRVQLIASKTNPFARLLPARLRQDESTVSSDFLAAHHAGITWYLNRRLTEASQSQKEMQEERVRRQLDRTRTLGSGAAREAFRITTQDAKPVPEESGGGSWLGEASSSLIAAAIGAPPPESPKGAGVQPAEARHPDSDDEDEELELSASQILQFETENANILRTVQDTLESVQQAESRLMDISALQMELVTHLAQQTELTDQLFEDAIATTATVQKGNVQLREAQRRAKDGRLFLLLFLVGASFSLLFLHYY